MEVLGLLDHHESIVRLLNVDWDATYLKKKGGKSYAAIILEVRSEHQRCPDCKQRVSGVARIGPGRRALCFSL